MRSWVKVILWMLITFVVVWAGVIYAWRSQHRMPETDEIALYLFGLPLGIFALLMLVRNYVQTKTAQAPLGTSNPQRQTDQAESIALANPTKAAHAWILDAAILCLHGDNPDDMIESYRSQQSALKLDEQLTDREGYPLLTGRMDGLDAEDIWQAFLAWQHNKGVPATEWLEEDIRAITLGTQAIWAMSDTLAELASHRMTTERNQEILAFPQLQLVTYLPSRWQPQSLETVNQWFTQQLTDHGWDANRVHFLHHTSDTPSYPFALINHLISTHQQVATSNLCIVIGCTSHIGEHSASIWDALPQHVKQQSGNALAEGAAGLLLALPSSSMRAIPRPASQVFLSGTASHQKYMVARGFIDPEVLTTCIQQALSAAQATAEDIALIISNGSKAVQQTVELTAMTNQHFSHLDFSEHYFSIATANGELEKTSDIMALALGHHLSKNLAENQGVVCVQHTDLTERHCVMIKKPSIQPSESTT